MIEIKSSLSVDEAINRLSREVKPSMLAAIKGESLVGEVTHSKVLLYRVVPFVGNSFLPVFRGSFTIKEGITYLIGDWTLHLYTKISSFFFFTFLLYTAVSQISTKGYIPWSLVSFYMFFGITMLIIWRLGKKMASGDKEWIIQNVTHILNPSS